SIESPSHNMITHTGEVLYSATSDKDDRVLLEIVSYPRNICSHLETVAQPDPGYLTQCRVGLLRSCRPNNCADTPLLRGPTGVLRSPGTRIVNPPESRSRRFLT